jgi:hypothetical protein
MTTKHDALQEKAAEEKDVFTANAEPVTDSLMVDLAGTWRLFEYRRAADGEILKGKVVRRRDSQATLQTRGKPARFETKQEAIDYAKRFLLAEK